MRYSLVFLLLLVIEGPLLAGQISLKYENNESLTYEEVISSYQFLDAQYKNAKLVEYGPTDSGKNLHVFFIGSDVSGNGENVEAMCEHKTVLLINNGIHPGEPCGVDASVAFARDVLEKPVPEDILLAIIPLYNIGGALNRNSSTRANQNGPWSYGFRGNARNLDLNRDFIKADALNTRSFYAVFQQLQPHIFIDTHTSNGADYQYTMTLISTQKDKLNPVLSRFLTEEMEPHLYQLMKREGYEMIPYVNVFGSTPDKGYEAFLETPRYASGYTALFNTIGFITEAHMLKPYADRVEATRAFLHIVLDYAGEHAAELRELKKEAGAYDRNMSLIDVDWALDSSKVRKMKFKGFAYDYPPSAVTGKRRLKYDNKHPVTYGIDYYDTSAPSVTVGIPDLYIVPAAWREVPLLLQSNGVEMYPLEKDSAIEVTTTKITSFEFARTPYEGHFPLQKLKVEESRERRVFRKGDYIVPTRQPHRRFIVNVLEAMAADSYLRWNFYDEVFQQKEWFSSYVFEDTAEEILEKDPVLKARFEKWKAANPEAAEDSFRQLYYIYRHTKAYEKEHLRYPVAKVYR